MNVFVKIVIFLAAMITLTGCLQHVGENQAVVSKADLALIQKAKAPIVLSQRPQVPVTAAPVVARPIQPASQVYTTFWVAAENPTRVTLRKGSKNKRGTIVARFKPSELSWKIRTNNGARYATAQVSVLTADLQNVQQFGVTVYSLKGYRVFTPETVNEILRAKNISQNDPACLRNGDTCARWGLFN